MMTSINDTQKFIISYLFRNDYVSQGKLSEVLNISKSAITQTLQPLIKENIIIKDDGVKTGKVGRREIPLHLNPDYGIFLGIDVRKHFYYLSGIDFSSNPLFSKRCENLSGVIKEINLAISNSSQCLGLAITIRGFNSFDEFKEKNNDFVSAILSLNIPVKFINNVECLAYVYKFYHPEDKSFILIKYGPGVGSSIFINGLPVGSKSEFGKMYVDDKKLEDTISFNNLYQDCIDESECATKLLNDSNLLSFSMKCLAKCLVNADALLSLDSIILAGNVLSNQKAIDLLKEEVNKIDETVYQHKEKTYENYTHLNEYKGAIMAFIEYTS